MKKYLSSIEDIIEEARKGNMFILVDAEDRENEGDLVIPADDITPDVVNFMSKYGRGLICLSLTEKRVDHLGLSLMSSKNKSRHNTAFTISIESREGVTTGISAKDRATTIATAISSQSGAEDIVSPGHIFPLKSKDGGVLVRAGHTEAAVDISRLSGKTPAGVVCEILNDDGSMARLPELVEFAKKHKLKIGTIADLINYRRTNDHIITKVMNKKIIIPSYGEWNCTVYNNNLDGSEHLAFVKGNIQKNKITPVRVHVINIFEDLIGISKKRSSLVDKAFKLISDIGFGVIVFIRDTNKNVISSNLSKLQLNNHGKILEIREYGLGAQILLDLGVRNIKLISDSKSTLLNIDGYNLKIVERQPLKG
ncbi:MAG: 3,4-dihydroxy-2-butanone-4-phosphate synthase [Pseudomonadota bacterium]|nr:3,4-dihydroxy-2-butanone-4-phosphate synthase [Pseudomonadota bacterium]